MSEMKPLVLGDTTETIIRVIFDRRVSQESTENNLSTINRTLKIRDLKKQIMGFIKRNHNAVFGLSVPEYKNDKKLKIIFSNFDSFNPEETEGINMYDIVVEDNFVEADVIHRVKVGKDIVLRIKAE